MQVKKRPLCTWKPKIAKRTFGMAGEMSGRSVCKSLTVLNSSCLLWQRLVLFKVTNGTVKFVGENDF